jgi:hypothetical protein
MTVKELRARIFQHHSDDEVVVITTDGECYNVLSVPWYTIPEIPDSTALVLSIAKK